MKQLIHCVAFLFCALGRFHAQQEKISIHEDQSKYYQNKETPPVEKISVLTGLDILLRDHTELLKGKSIALVTNQTGIDHDGVPNYKRLMAMEKVNLQVIFSPEHGLFGEAAAGQKVSYNQNAFNLPEVISLYGKTRKPTPKMLHGIQLIIYDIQDIGSRFYTYITTLGLIMEAAGEQNIPVLVLDRPNPIRGDIIAGPLLDMNYKTFVGYYPIPIRYGGTIGDMAKKIKSNIGADNLLNDLSDSFKSNIDETSSIIKDFLFNIESTVKDEEIKEEAKELINNINRELTLFFKQTNEKISKTYDSLSEKDESKFEEE